MGGTVWKGSSYIRENLAKGTKTQVGGGTEATGDTGRGEPNHHKQQNCAKEKHLDQKQPSYHCHNNRSGLKCMYPNLDSYNNKRSELLTRIAQYQPDVIGLTEIMPKHTNWKLLMEDMTIQGYTAYVNFKIWRDRTHYAIQSEHHHTKNQDKLLIGVIYRSPAQQSWITLIMTSSWLLQWSTNILATWWLWGILTIPVLVGKILYPLDQRWNRDSWTIQRLLLMAACHTTNQIQSPTGCKHSGPCDDQWGNVPCSGIQWTNRQKDHLVLNWTDNSYSEQSTSVMVKRLYNYGNYDNMREDLEGTNWINILKDITVDEQWIIIRTRILDAVNTIQKFVDAPCVTSKSEAWDGDD